MPKKLTFEQLTRLGLEEALAGEALHNVNQLLSSLPPSECWQKISTEILTPDHPFQLHRLLYETVFADWDLGKGPPPAWTPSREQVQNSNIAGLVRKLGLNCYEELHAWSVQNRGEFWDLMTQRLDIQFKQPYTKAMDLSNGVESPQWLVDARLNIADSCFNALQDSIAITAQTESGASLSMTYKELESLTNRVANALAAAGLKTGDAIGIDMPMTAESVAIYLGIVKAGCVAISVADSFAPEEIKMRLRLANAKAIFTQDYIRRTGKLLPLYAKVVSANAPKAVVLSEIGPTDPIQLRKDDLTWEQFLVDDDMFDSVSCFPSDHTNILFSSGTTGEPKAIPWTQTTPIKCAADGYLHHNIKPGDKIAWPTNLGWMMGPWLIYASLINHATIALYYGAPTGRDFGRFVQDVQVNTLGVVPGLVRTWKDTNCMDGLDWSSIKTYSSTGECSNVKDMLFLMSLAGYRPIIEYCGGTEIGGGYITGTVVQPASPATFSTPALGIDFVILDENGHRANNGELFLIPPSIGLSTELLNKDHHEVYFEGTPRIPNGSKTEDVPALRRHGDQMEHLGDGYYRAHGRVDDTMNIAGIKISSAEIERVLNSVKGIRETAAIAVPPPDGGPNRLVIHAVLLPDTNTAKEDLKKSMQDEVKSHLNPLFKIHDVVIVSSLPRTASSKVMRRMLRDNYSDES